MLDFVIDLARQAGKYLKDNLGQDLQVEYKGRINPVTRIDKASQELILSGIEKKFPGHSIIAEEGSRKDTGDEFTWFVDPLDGTVNYVHGIPIFCVSIGIYKRNMPYIGVCYNPMSDELFYAQTGKGAYLNCSKIAVSSTSRLINALVVTGFPYSADDMDSVISRFCRILGEVQGVRRLGSAALDLCKVATGSFDGFWEVGLHPWDMAAGVVIVKEAGGVCSGFDGNLHDLWRGDILAGNPAIHEELKRLV